MQVEELMSPAPLGVRPDNTLAESQRVMETESIRHLPVVQDRRLVGMLSERDVLTALGDDGHPVPNRPQTVGEIMQKEPLTTSPAAPVSLAAGTLKAARIGCLPVIGDDGAVVGVLTDMDLLVVCQRRGADRRAGDHMSVQPITVAPDDSIQDASSTCFAAGVRHLPVVDGGCLVGIISDRDLRGAAASGGPDALTVAARMSRDVHTADVDTSLADVARIMIKDRISAVPVVDGDRLLGIVTTIDLIATLAEEL